MRSLGTLGCVLALSSILAAPVQGQGEDPVEVARALLAAFNAHDPEAMADLVTPSFELYYMSEDGSAGLALTGPEALREEMTAYFEALPAVQSEFRGAIGGHRFVAFREFIVGGDSSLVVYEIEGQKVRRAWYYPEEPGRAGDG